jgi:succinate dehydrogenase / fumarate reductase flavoprotein subunit
MNKYKVYQYDVLVIGSGGAGLRAAIEAQRKGVKVAVVCKSLLGKAHTVMAEGGIAAALGNLDPDNWQTHFKDTMFGGKYINDWRMVEIHAKESPERISELEKWGAVFDRTKDGRVLQRPFGGHTYRRLCHVGDRTGLEMIRTLQEKIVALKIDVFMECMVTDILLDEGRVSGAFGFFKDTGKFIVFNAKAIILATGGIGRIWRVTTNSWDCTADGFALAFFAGAELKDMEFVQFHPTGMVWPPGVKGLLVTEAVRGDGGILKNNKGERFMQKYDPHLMELSTRDVVARAIDQEVREGRGTEHGGVYLDISHKPPSYVKKKLPSMYDQFLEFADVDITKQAMEVGPTCHYMMGGIKVDSQTQMSNLKGLFAAGEVASGLHGANRLGGNSLSDLLVFGKRAGEAAASYAKQLHRFPYIDEDKVENHKKELISPFENKGKYFPSFIHSELQNIMEENVALRRDEEGLIDTLKKLEILTSHYNNIYIEGNSQYNFGWHITISLKFMLTVAKIITRASLERKESRGALFRADFPYPSEEWGKKSVVVKYKNGEIATDIIPIESLPSHLEKLVEEDRKKWLSQGK